MRVSIRLWLDDKRTPPSPDWVWAPTSAWALQLLEAYHVYEISFDHDLGLLIDGTEDKGTAVAEWFEQKAHLGMIDVIPVWWVHSSNPPGRENIIRIMQSAERILQGAHACS